MQQRIHYSLCVIIPPMWCGADFSFILASAKAVLYHQRNKLAANKATFCTCQKKKKHFGRLYLLYKMSHYRANCSTYTRRIISEITLFKLNTRCLGASSVSLRMLPERSIPCKWSSSSFFRGFLLHFNFFSSTKHWVSLCRIKWSFCLKLVDWT